MHVFGSYVMHYCQYTDEYVSTPVVAELLPCGNTRQSFSSTTVQTCTKGIKRKALTFI